MPYETDAKHFPADLLHLLRYQGRRMNAVLHGMIPPDRKEALRIQERVDGMLDRRPRTHSIAPDGEIVWDGGNSWITDQALPPGTTAVVNETGYAEQVIPQVAQYIEEPAGGGVGVIDRDKPLTLEQEADVARFGKMLGNLPEAGK